MLEGSRMISVQVISPGVLEATPGGGSKGTALGLAGAAIEATGFYDSLPSLGAALAGIVRPQLAPGQASGDPVVDLGAYNRLIAGAVAGALASGTRPVLVGGSCSHLPGMFAGLQAAFGPTARIGLIWLDAHGDFNTPAISPSGMLGGMPVAVVAGLCLREWREGAGIQAFLPTNRIVMVDVRNLDPDEHALIAATDIVVARFGPDFETTAIDRAIVELASTVDHLYLHIDADILDEPLQPNHPTAEPDGPDNAAVARVIDAAMATGKVAAFAVVSINPREPGGDVSLASGIEMLRAGISGWSQTSPGV
jgi:arginase